jgi:hypothetical protein
MPTCVILVEQQDAARARPESMTFPSQMIGGGYPVLTEVQGRTQFASIGCLVSDGHTTYALTNAHVTGPHGETVSTVVTGATRQLGVADAKRVTRKRFDEVYPAWDSPHTYVNLDAGLIRIDDLENRRTNQLGKSMASCGQSHCSGWPRDRRR